MKTVTKEYIRKLITEKKNNLTQTDVLKRSNKICDNLLDIKEFKQCKNVLIYVSMPKEVQTFDLILKLFNDKKIIIVPVVKKNCEMLFLSKLTEEHINELAENKQDKVLSMWNKSKFGILEPKENTLKHTPISDIDLVIVPGLGFNVECSRVGFGGGYYDRLLVKLKDSITTIAVAFDFQILPYIPCNDFDQKVDMIVTEKRIIVP